jgi:hypothetical protein
MNEYTLVALVIGLAVGLVLGFFRGIDFWIKQMIEDPNGVARVLNSVKKNEEAKEDSETMTVEKHDGVLYAFTSNGDFLAQAATMSELLAMIEKRFPNRVFKSHMTMKQAKEMGVVQ